MNKSSHDTRVFLVEGLPAAGKTTFSKKLHHHLTANGRNCLFFPEESSQPVDLFRQAVMTPDQYDCFIDRCQKLSAMDGSFSYDDVNEQLEKNLYRSFDRVVIAYTMLDTGSPIQDMLMRSLRQYDIGDGRTTFDQYRQYHLLLWKHFSDNYAQPETDYVLEGAYLHNQLFDLMGFYDLSEQELSGYFEKLLGCLSNFYIKIYYICTDNIEKLVEKSIVQRGTGNGTWTDGFEKWLRRSPYGRRHKLGGRSGMVRTYNDLNTIASKILLNLPCDVEYIVRNE